MSEYMYIKFNERIKECMKKKKITQDKLADMLDYEQPYISKICNTKSNKDIPNIELIDKIATVLDTTVPYLLGYIDNEAIENAAITNEIGLGDKAIKNLKMIISKENIGLLSNFPEFIEDEISTNKAVLNDLIGSDSFLELFDLIKNVALFNKTDKVIAGEFKKLTADKKEALDYYYLTDESLKDSEKYTLHHLSAYEQHIIRSFDRIASMEYNEKEEYRKYFTIKSIQEILDKIYK